MPILPQIFPVLRLSLCAALMILCCGVAMSQSGRRVRKPVLEPVPAAEPTPTPKPTDTPKPGLSFIVGMDRNGSFASVSRAVYDGALQSLAERLDLPESVKVEVQQRDMGRGEAVTRAKAEKEAYIVWFEIRPDMTSVDNGPGDNPGNTVWIEYSVFTPGTAKIVTSGRAYRGYRNKSILSRRPSDLYGDEALNQAAREAAERILASFKILAPAGRYPNQSTN